jgi:multiple antibiotic resistance protein
VPNHPFSMAISLFFVINILGNIPLFIGLLARYKPRQQRLILIREFSLALILLLLFNFFGNQIFEILGVTQPVLGMAGGILLLFISIGMIFPKHEAESTPKHEPILVPLATPVIAGPGSITAVMLFAAKLDNHMTMTMIIIGAIFVSFVIALIASFLKQGLGEKGLLAFERLGGMIVALIAVQMFASGAVDFVKQSFSF